MHHLGSLNVHEIELNEDEGQRKGKFIALKDSKGSLCKAFKDKEPYEETFEEEGTNEDELSFISKRIHSISQREERHGRRERYVRNEREERHGRCIRNRRDKEEPRRQKLDNGKERMKVSLVTLEFSDYALLWWNQVLENIRRRWRDPCESWGALKRIMRERFVPSYYTRDLYNKLQRLYHGSKSVEEYQKEMKMDLMRAQIVESKKAIMSRMYLVPPNLVALSVLSVWANDTLPPNTQIGGPWC
ncbi:hypothetical protein CR513_46939, partial [Mucuna pruriens]